ncbi:hypothetical protein O4H49_14610 [Kiloniella laminariae]|uniref:Uncharacterized protein n=1 Tax=Kiloniella laminariae TaxID=454162 RepID=A0ABT4LLQ2_9PROT|nr:hypothetical protein [Kiloniella laminariae]MCZ4282017.1 hypothetical protein [Kiloniella laminariae]
MRKSSRYSIRRMVLAGPVLLGTLLLLSPGFADEGQAGLVRITRQDCQQLVAHVPADDVAYTPGVTARGEKVVPADLNAQTITLPEVIRIPITVDLYKRFNIPANPNNFEAEAEIGVVEVHKDGTTLFNGTPIQSEEQRELSLKCQEILNKQ